MNQSRSSGMAGHRTGGLGRVMMMFAMGLLASSLAAQTSDPPAATSPQPPTSEAEKSSETEKNIEPSAESTTVKTEETTADKPLRDFFKPSKAEGVNHRPQPPAYVKTFDKHGKTYGIPGTEDLSWLEFGLEQRTRFENRNEDYRYGLRDTHQFLLRSDMYIGIRDILDPLRFGLELQDSRQYQGSFPENASDVDEFDVLQAFMELYFKDAIGPDRPLIFRAGRMSLDLANRRLVARNGFRNTTNAFDGFRLTLGQKSNDWQMDILAAMPVERLLQQPDRPDEERWLYAWVGTWRGWSEIITIETYYIVLDEDRKPIAALDREIHNIGVHGFGPIGESGFDYDFDFTWQFGNDNSAAPGLDRTRRAFAAHAELGYSFDLPWKPRLSAYCNYASGDRDPRPRDHLNERFDSLYGDSFGYGIMNIQRLENMINPNIRLSLAPHDKVEFNGFYRWYFVASDSDRSSWAGRVDPTGRSGDYVGSAVDLVMKYKVCPNFNVEMGYSHFTPGNFIERTGDSENSDFFYVQTTLQF